MWRIVVYRGAVSAAIRDKFLGKGQHWGWYSRSCLSSLRVRHVFFESRCLGMQRKVGGKFHLKLNIGARPIANKYREGKMKRTLKRELKSTWNCWKGIESFPVSIIHNIFHWRVGACNVFGSGLSVPDITLHLLAGALCCGGMSESVRMLREMVGEKVGRVLALGCYISSTSSRGWDWGAYNVL